MNLIPYEIHKRPTDIYLLDKKYVWQDLYLERQKLYYIFFGKKDNLKDLYDFYTNYLKLSIGEFTENNDLDFIKNHNWQYYDTLYQNGNILLPNYIIAKTFDKYVDIKRKIIFDRNINNINKEKITLKDIEYYYRKNKLLNYNNEYNLRGKVKFSQDEKTGEIIYNDTILGGE